MAQEDLKYIHNDINHLIIGPIDLEYQLFGLIPYY